MAIRVMLFEDSDEMRDSLAVLIAGTPGYEVVGAFPHFLEGLEQVASLKPDVVLMDIDLPNVNGIAATVRLKKKFPWVEVLILTIFQDDDKVFDAVCAGATGYLLKSAPPVSILQAIQEIHQGGAPMSPHIARKVLRLFPGPSTPSPELDKLTPREREVLDWLSKGYSYKMVGNELNISLDTVRTHVKHVYDKLHVHSLAEAIAKAYLNP